PIQCKNHPFRFLLYLEWALLFITVLTEALPAPPQRYYHSPLLSVLIVVAFGVMGLRLPTGKAFYKVIYTSLEVLLIICTTLTGSRALRMFPFLHLILVTRSCLIFQLPGRLVATGLSFALFLWTLMPLTRRLQRIPAKIVSQEPIRLLPLGYVFLFALCLVFVLLLISAVRAERQSREKLMVANEQLRQYALRIENQATLQERNRIAREIHDSLGHSLTALNLQLETALKLGQSNPVEAQAFLERSKQLGSKALSDVRHSVSALRTDPLQGRPIENAIASLAEEFHRSTGISPSCSMSLGRSLPAEVNTAVYRITQEALTNISKYAGATEVKIQLKATLTNLRLSIEDNGRGFSLDQTTTGFGLQSMRDRTLALGGQFKIDSAPSSGCRITADIPLARLPE
ncbi:MAG TPA: sensor histidine kinase, partial [Oculatellaceae cyanobacterium]